MHARLGFVLALGGLAPGCAPAAAPAPPPVAQAVNELPDDLVVAADDFDGCPVEGTAIPADVRALNILKNRSAEPTAQDADSSVTLAAMLAPDSDDTRRFDAARAAQLTAVVHRVLEGGVETTNCRATDSLHRDTHIELIVTPSDSDKTRRVIVEVTPRWRAAARSRGVDWSTGSLAKSLTGHRVLVRGWLMFDAEHAGESENTNPGGASDWRATAWEIHPLTNLGVLPGP